MFLCFSTLPDRCLFVDGVLGDEDFKHFGFIELRISIHILHHLFHISTAPSNLPAMNEGIYFMFHRNTLYSNYVK